MSASCCSHDHCHAPDPQRGNDSYRRVLWAVLAINAGMFAVEVIAGLAAGSASLQADALDFLGDAGNYGISLFVVGMTLRYRAMAAAFKGATMAVFGLWVIGVAGWHAWYGTLPHAFTMGGVGLAALSPTPLPSASYGPTGVGTRTCAPPGFAPVTTCSAISRCFSRPLACSALHRMARCGRGRDHGRSRASRGVRGAQPVTSGVALAYAGSSRVGCQVRVADHIGGTALALGPVGVRALFGGTDNHAEAVSRASLTS